MLEDVLDSGTGQFCPLLLKIVERGITHRRRGSPVKRDEIEQLNGLVARLGFKIPELSDPEFIERLPKQGKLEPNSIHGNNPQSLADLQGRLLKLTVSNRQERGFGFEKFLSDLLRFMASRHAAPSG